MVEVYPYQAWAVVEVCQGQQGSPAYQEGVVVEEEVVVQHRSYQALVAVEVCLQGSQAGPEEAVVVEVVEGLQS